MNYFRKAIPASVAGAVAGIVVGALFGPSAGTTTAADISRRWMRQLTA